MALSRQEGASRPSRPPSTKETLPGRQTAPEGLQFIKPSTVTGGVDNRTGRAPGTANLWLLPSGSDQVRRRPSHGARLSTPPAAADLALLALELFEDHSAWRRLLHRAALQRFRRNVGMANRAVLVDDLHPLNVRANNALRLVIGMADVIANLPALPSYFALCHDSFPYAEKSGSYSLGRSKVGSPHPLGQTQIAPEPREKAPKGSLPYNAFFSTSRTSSNSWSFIYANSGKFSTLVASHSAVSPPTCPAIHAAAPGCIDIEPG